jgi:hypothetical protein
MQCRPEQLLRGDVSLDDTTIVPPVPKATQRQGACVRWRRLPAAARHARHHVYHEPSRELLKQRSDGELFSTVKFELGEPLESCGEAKMQVLAPS